MFQPLNCNFYVLASCCGSSMYEPTQQICCPFRGAEKLHSIIPKTDCCALELYNYGEFTCDTDMGKLYPKNTDNTKTCGHTTYDPTKEVCCMDTGK